MRFKYSQALSSNAIPFCLKLFTISTEQELADSQITILKSLKSKLLFNPSRLSDLAPKIIELRSPDTTFPDDLDLLDPRRMQRKNPLHTHTIGNLPDSERPADSAVLLRGI